MEKNRVLPKKKIGVFIESDYYEHEIWYYKHRFLEAGVAPENLHFFSRLWGQSSLTFKGHEYHAPFECRMSFESIGPEDLKGYAAIVVPSGMVADRLRFYTTTHPDRAQNDPTGIPRATRLLARAFADRTILKGIICHGLWLAAPMPELVRGRRMTCHNNLRGDALAYGVEYVDKDLVEDGDIVSARTGDDCHLLAGRLIDRIG